MTIAYDRASLPASGRLWSDDRKAGFDINSITQSSKKAIKQGLRVLLILALFGGVTVGVIALKALIVMSRFNYLHS